MSLVFSALGIDPWFSLSIDVGEHSSNVDTAEGFCKYMFDTYGDASSVEINDEDSNEHNLRDLWNEMDYSKSFSCSWEIGDKENSMRLTISYNYYEITSSEFSHFGVSV